MSRKKDERTAAATAAQRGGAALIVGQGLKTLAPIVAKAALQASVAKKVAAPVAGVAKDHLAPVADQAKDRLAPLADQAKEQAAAAKEKVAPLAATAAVGSVELAHRTRQQLQPHLDELADRVQPHVEGARSRVQEELVPQIVDLLHQAETHPAVSEASRRSQAAAAALRGDLELPQKKQRSLAGALGKLVVAGAVLGAAALAVRQFLAAKDDAWTAHQPSTAYTNPAVAEEPKTWVDETSTPAAGDEKATDAPAGETAPEDAKPAQPAAAEKAPAVTPDVDSEPDPEELMSAEGGPADEAETTNEDLAVLNVHGEGSYVGDEPPSDYRIKGNERSMKYHTPDSTSYERTIADVWFTNTEAAEKAGFTKAQR